MRQMDPEGHEGRFKRIVAIAGLPSFEAAPAGTTVDVDRLLKLRDADERREFRAWLRGVDSETDDEISQRFDSVRRRVASAVGSGAGRTIRFLVTTLAGAIPVAGPIVGPALDAGDTFLVDRVIGRPGPAVFLARHYPSIFVDPTG